MSHRILRPDVFSLFLKIDVPEPLAFTAKIGGFVVGRRQLVAADLFMPARWKVGKLGGGQLEPR
jgi:hypothetical protein